MKKAQPLIFERSHSGRGTDNLPTCDVPQWDGLIPANLLRSEAPALPEVSEPELVRHFTALSNRNFGVDSGAYPLGSCTMKYNPKINEEMARLPGFACVHPLQPQETVQGCLKLLYETDRMLSEITGMERFTLQPAAGAHGEMTGLMIIKAYHDHNGESGRNKIIIPDSAHGTNPASAAVAGFEVVSVPSDANGMVDLEALAKALDHNTAGLMLTNPNTLGLFDANIKKIADMVHAAGGLLYYDGANANAILGIARPGDMGFDVVHLNLHKSFSTPHGGGGPGSGPVGVKAELAGYLPYPLVEKKGEMFVLNDNMPLSIGRVRSFWGNFGIVVRAYTYLRRMGAEGLPEVAKNAVLNANYILYALKEDFDLPYGADCMHEVVFSASRQKKNGVSALDIAKRLLDFGYHPPTIYFPLIVSEALMIEPTETESKESLDAFIEAMRTIAHEAEECPDEFKAAPKTTVVGRMDESRAAREVIVRYKP